jgi:6-phosphogluconolactonase
VHSVVFTPDGKFLAVTDLGTDKIILYPFDADKKKPVNEKGIEVKSNPGNGPRHVIFHQSLPYAYVIDELSGTVSAFTYNDGKAEALQTISSHPENYSGSIGSAAIRISPDGKFLYASNRGESNTIATYSIGQDGRLTLKGIVNSGGKAPRDFNIDPTGQFLLSANGGSDNITIFRLDANTGVPQEPGKQVDIPQPVSLVFF